MKPFEFFQSLTIETTVKTLQNFTPYFTTTVMSLAISFFSNSQFFVSLSYFTLNNRETVSKRQGEATRGRGYRATRGLG